MEDLAGVPGAVVGCDRAYAWLWADERTARERGDVLAGGGAVADEVLGDEYAVAGVDSENALVQELVVQRAEAQPVVDVVRSAECPPAHVCGFQSDRNRADPAVVAAEGAPVLVGGEDQFAHASAPLSARGHEVPGLRRLQLQADGFTQLAVERGRKVQIEQ